MNRRIRFTLILCILLAVVCVGALLLYPGNEPRQPEHAAYPLQISEICPKNETILADNTGRYRDYIELHNVGTEPVDLSGFRLTDGQRTGPAIEGIVLQPGAYRTFFLGDDLTGFSLSASGGDSIQLLDSHGHIVFQTKVSAAGADQVMSLRGSTYLLSDQATPGFSNDTAGRTAFLTGSQHPQPQLVISEVLIGNTSAYPDSSGYFGDMVELCNTGEEAVFLGDFFLSDSGAARFRFRLPDSWLAPGAFLLLCCSGEAGTDPSGLLHTNFGLTNGETLYLTDSLGRHSSLPLSYLGEDVSCSLTDGSFVPSRPSLGFANTEAGIHAFTQSRRCPDPALVISEVLPSSAGVPYNGAITDVVEIYNRSSSPVSTQGWYLSDGGDPKAYPLPPQTLKPGQYLVIPCGPGLTGFGLSSTESAVLMTPDWQIASCVSCTSQPGYSLSLQSDDGDSFRLSVPSPGFSNDEDGQAAFQASAVPELAIWELMSSNESWLKGSYGVTCDWVELTNTSRSPISLRDYCFTDDPQQLSQYPLPDLTLAPGQSCVLLLSPDPTDLLKGYSVLPFSLSSSGEQLYLTKSGQVMDYMLLPPLEADISFGRNEDHIFTRLASPTPGQPNAASAPISGTPTVRTPQGIYPDVSFVDVVLEGPGDIYYTLDGATPGPDALRYTGPIRLHSSAALRAVCREPGKAQSQTLDLTYIINEQDTLDVVCLVTDPKNLFDPYTGIYVAGVGGEQGDYPYYSANYWQDWERPATVSLFPLEGEGFSEPCGIRIHGAFSRAQDKKSLAVLFRGSYGCSSLRYPLFGSDGLDSYQSFLLRALGQDAAMTRMRDEIVTSLVGDYTNVAVQKYRPVAVYINGQYWGLHYIREKISEHYVAGNYHVSAEDVTMAELNGVGVPEYQDMVRYARTHDLNVQEYYDHLCSMTDVEIYADYIIAQICVGNTDNANVKFFKTAEGKWTWILYDTDLALRSADHNTIAEHLDPEGSAYMHFLDTTLINALLERREFKDWFLSRMAWQLTTIWSPETLTARIDALSQTIRQAVSKDSLRWNLSDARWETHLEALYQVAENRAQALSGHIQDYFSLTDHQMAQYGFPAF